MTSAMTHETRARVNAHIEAVHWHLQHCTLSNNNRDYRICPHTTCVTNKQKVDALREAEQQR
jgi:hypothetical protein